MTPRFTLTLLLATALTLPLVTTAHAGARMQRQNARIDAGVAAGTIDAGTAQQLKVEHKAVKNAAQKEKTDNGGTLTGTEKTQLGQSLGAESKLIKNTKAAAVAGTPVPSAQMNARLQTQKVRVQEGVQTGALTTTQAQAIHSKTQAIHQSMVSQASAQGTSLTADQQATYMKQLNGSSARIHNQKAAGATGVLNKSLSIGG